MSLSGNHGGRAGQRVFALGERISATFTTDDRFHTAVKIRQRADGTTVWRGALADYYGADPDLSLSIPTDVDSTTRQSGESLFPSNSNDPVPLPLLPAGDYVVEEWNRGRPVRSADITISPFAATAPESVTVIASLEASLKRSRFPNPQRAAAREVAALDAFVGLTAAQKRTALEAYVDWFRPASDVAAGRLATERSAVAGQMPASVRALLTPEQQRLLADDGSAFRGGLIARLSDTDRARLEVSPQLNVGGPADAHRQAQIQAQRLDALVHLSPSQRDAATKVFAEQNVALSAYALGRDRAEQGAPIRRKARADIRALLTPAQQAIYDQTPQRLGGGSYHDPALHPQTPAPSEGS